MHDGVGQLAVDIRAVPNSPTPLSRLSALDDRFGHQDREVMLRKIDQFFDGLSA